MDDLFQITQPLDGKTRLSVSLFRIQFLVFDLDPPRDNILIQTQHEDTTGRVQKQLDGFQHLDGFFRQATVEIVHEDDEAAILFEDVRLNKFGETLLELLQRGNLLNIEFRPLARDGVGGFVQAVRRVGLQRLAEFLQHISARQERQTEIHHAFANLSRQLGQVNFYAAQFFELHTAIQQAL